MRILLLLTCALSINNGSYAHKHILCRSVSKRVKDMDAIHPQDVHILCRSVSKPLRGAAGCWGGTEKSVSGPDFNGIERGLVVYRRPLGLAANEALATQHFRRRFESCHRTLVDSHRPSVSELEPAFALPRCHGVFFRSGRADECCGLFIFRPEHEMHLRASLLIGTPEKSKVFCTTQKTPAIDTLQQASCSLWVGCR